MKNKIHAKMKAKGVCIMSLEQKIDKFLEKKSKRSNFLIFLVVILCVGTMPLMFVDAFYGTGMDDAGTGITAIVSCIFFVFACCYMFKDYLVSMLVGTPQMARNNSTKKEDVIIVNAIFKKHKDGGYLFEGRNNQVIVKRDAQDAIGSLYFEKFLEEGRQYCILFSRYPDYPLAVFEGYYNGTKYSYNDL